VQSLLTTTSNKNNKHTMVLLLFFFGMLVAQCGRAAGSPPLQVVSVDGMCKSSSAIGAFVASSAKGGDSSGGLCPVSAAFDCGSESDGYSVFNSILETSFPANSKGVLLEVTDRAAFAYTAFETMFSPKFCGSKAADYCSTVSNCIFVLLSGKDASETLHGYDQLFRRMLGKIHASSSPVRSITFFVKVEGASGGTSGVDIGAVTQEITRHLQDMWADLDASGGDGAASSLSDRVSVDVVAVDVSDVASIQYARASVAAAVEKAVSSGTAAAPSALGNALSTAWSDIPAGMPRAALSPVSLLPPPSPPFSCILCRRLILLLHR
jgi:hypothetical protein